MNIFKVPPFSGYRYNRKLLEDYTHEAFAVMLPTAAYIVESEGKAAVINAPGNIGAILDILGKRGLTLTHILLTNGRVEHSYALDELVKKTGAPVYIHKHDYSALEGYAADAQKLLELEIPPVYRGGLHTLDEGDEIQLGKARIIVLHTPGMTEGSVCYKTGSTLFTGDLLGRQAVGFPGLPGSNSAHLLRSLERIRDLDEEFEIYPSHWGATTLSLETKTNLATLPRARIGVMVSLIDEPEGT